MYVLALAGALALVQSAPSATDIVAAAKASEKAHRPKSEIQDWDLKAYGLTGHEHLVRRGDDEATTNTLGPFSSARGKLAGKAWHQNENGYTVMETNVAPTTEGISPVTSRTATRVTSPVAAYLVTIKHANGLVERDYYAESDYLLLRQEYSYEGHTSTLVFDDIRPRSGGGRIAWHYSGGDGEPGNSYEGRMTSDLENPAIDDAALTIPPTRRNLVEFPSGENTVKLPADIEGHIRVQVTINGHPMWFIIDSGASDIVINEKAAKEVGLQTYGKGTFSVAGVFQSSRTIAPTLEVGDLTLHNVVMRTAPVDFDEGDKRVVGLLGFDFIAGTVLRVDYSYNSVEAIAPSHFTQPILATAQTAIQLGEQVPVVSVGVDSTTSRDMIVDTGAMAPVLFFDRFVEQHPDALHDVGLGRGYDASQSYVGGVGGYVNIVPLRLASFRFAGLDFKNFVVLRASQAGAFGDFRNDGLLGALFLRYFTVYLDYPELKMYFEPNDTYQKALDAGGS